MNDPEETTDVETPDRPPHVGKGTVLASEGGIAMRVQPGVAVPLAVAELRFIDDEGAVEVVSLTVKQVGLLKQLRDTGLFGTSYGEVVRELVTQRLRRMAEDSWFE